MAPSTATEHLHRLIEGGVLTEQRQGRHRYVALAGPQVAELIEDLSARLRPSVPPVKSLKAAVTSKALARGRTCYDHLAGRIGVAITDAMVADSLIQTVGGFALSDNGFAWFGEELGIDTTQWSNSRRPVARQCLDWTERRPHLAGVAGAELCRSLLDRGWVRRIGSGRAVRATAEGADGLRRLLGIEPDALEMVATDR